MNAAVNEYDPTIMAEGMDSGLWMPFMATPALPLVGLGVLGLLLAGRGAWLRRRRSI